MSQKPEGGSSADFIVAPEMHSGPASASIPRPSEVVHSQILNALRLPPDGVDAAAIREHLSVIDDGQPRVPAFEEALGVVYRNRPSRPLAREQIATGRDMTIVSKDGHRFNIVTELGRGGFGSVYLAEDPEHEGQPQAIKELSGIAIAPENKDGHWVAFPSSADTKSAVPRFNREAHLAEKATQKGLDFMMPRYLGRGERVVRNADGTAVLHPYIQYEFVRSVSMQQLGEGLGDERLPLPAFYDLAAYVSAGMHAFHKAGLIHRDVKPANLLIRADAKAVMIIDLGLARDVSVPYDASAQETDTRMTQNGVAMGTAIYMPPEQWSDVASATAKSDWYSTFLSLYFTLTGKNVFTGSASELFAAHSTMKPTSALAELKRIGLPQPLLDLFERGLEKNPDDRPSGDEILQEFLRHSSVGADQKPDQFLKRLKAGECRLKLPKDLLESVSNAEAPFPYGFQRPETMVEALRFSYTPEQVTEQSRGGMRRLLWPTVMIAGAGAVALGVIGYSRSGTPLLNVESAATAPQVPPSAGEKPVTLPEKEVFASSDLFEGVTENGSLAKITFFKGKPCEFTLSADRFTTHLSKGKVVAVTFTMPEEAAARYSGVSEAELPDDIRARHGSPAKLVLDPVAKKFVWAIDKYGISSASESGVHVYSNFAGDRIGNVLGLKGDKAPEEDCLKDPDIVAVVDAFLASELDAPSEKHAQQHQELLDTVKLWKQLIDSRAKAAAN